MPQSAKELWKRVLEGARRDLPEPMIQTWLAPNDAISFEDGTLLVSTPDDFAKRWNEEKYAAILGRVATEAAGEPVVVAFQVAADRQKRPQMDLFVPTAPPADAAPVPTPVNPSAQPLNDRYTFGQFVIGKSNELA
ncbi:MAG TPA: DnaA N-terminal domain-containing protein, partial [Microlunatus sp.]|nr:DnaA N-terminal domain-containing protein [Microlunatus sp.]